jgi:hypothetical protein
VTVFPSSTALSLAVRSVISIASMPQPSRVSEAAAVRRRGTVAGKTALRSRAAHAARREAAEIGSAVSAAMGRSKPTATRLAAPEPARGPALRSPSSLPGGGGGSDDSNDLACQICIRTDGADKMVLCDACSDGYHTHCMRPPRRSVPRGAWLCPTCVRLAVARGIKLRDMVVLLDERHCFTCRKPTGRGARCCVECRLCFHASCFAREEGNSASRNGPEFRCRLCTAARLQAQTSTAPDVVVVTAGAASDAKAQCGVGTARVPEVRASLRESSPKESLPEVISNKKASIECDGAPSDADAKMCRSPRKSAKDTVSLKRPRRAAQKGPAAKPARKPAKAISKASKAVSASLKKPSETAKISKDTNGAVGTRKARRKVDILSSTGTANGIPQSSPTERSKSSGAGGRRHASAKDADKAALREVPTPSPLTTLEDASLKKFEGNKAELVCDNTRSAQRPAPAKATELRSPGLLSSSFLSTSTSPATRTVNVRTGQLSETHIGNGAVLSKEAVPVASTTGVPSPLPAGSQTSSDVSKRPRQSEHEEKSPNALAGIRGTRSAAAKHRKTLAIERGSASGSEPVVDRSPNTRVDTAQTLVESTDSNEGRDLDLKAPLRNTRQTILRRTGNGRAIAPRTDSKCSGSSEDVASNEDVPPLTQGNSTSRVQANCPEEPVSVRPPGLVDAEREKEYPSLGNGVGVKVLEDERSNDLFTRLRSVPDILPAMFAPTGEGDCDHGVPSSAPSHVRADRALTGSEQTGDKQNLASQTQIKLNEDKISARKRPTQIELNDDKVSARKRPRPENDSFPALLGAKDNSDSTLALTGSMSHGLSPGRAMVATLLEYSDAGDLAKANSSSDSSVRTVKDPSPVRTELPAVISIPVSHAGKAAGTPLHNVAAPEVGDGLLNEVQQPHAVSPLEASVTAEEEARTPFSSASLDRSPAESLRGAHELRAVPSLQSGTPDQELSGEEAAMVMAAALQAGADVPNGGVPNAGASQLPQAQVEQPRPPIVGASSVPGPPGVTPVVGHSSSTPPLNFTGVSSLPSRTSFGRGGGPRRQGRPQVPSHVDDPLFVAPGQVRNWHILNVCVGKPFHSGLFVDLPYTSFFEDNLRVIYSGGGLLRAVAFSKRRCSRTDALREWWLSNRLHFPLTSINRETMPLEAKLEPTPRD